MRMRIKWGVTIIALLFLVLFSILAPRLADAWADQNTIGKLSYETITYEPYQPIYYSTFEEKLEAMAACMTTDTMSYAIQLYEGDDAPDDQALLNAANQELQALYQNGILSEKITADSLFDRSFMEVYVLPQGEESAALPDLYFWKLTVPTENGQIVLCMDRSFYKIYCISFETEYADGATSSYTRISKTEPDNIEALAQKWCRYWELDDVVLTDDPTENESENGYIYDASIDSDSIYIRFPTEHDMAIVYERADFISYGKDGGQWIRSGLLAFTEYW